ncbi:MAG: hypothetical protein A2Y78_12890 [Acidobacteria bacterium RBG_13_68_16]|nr:MAG: hypothetical protein A2Y78_12890 [Acidobacteria bacterium RBG_13_68_16]
MAAGILKLTLTRTIAGEAADTITIAPSVTVRRVEELAQAIVDLDKGWCVGFRAGRDTEWASPWPSQPYDWPAALVKTGRIPRHARPIHLAITDADVTAYGYQPAELRFYQIMSAAVWALEALDRSGAVVTSRSEADMSVSFDIAGRLQRAYQRATLGIYA